jgi:hypothetical protein
MTIALDIPPEIEAQARQAAMDDLGLHAATYA